MQLDSFGQLLHKSNLLLYSAEKCQKSSHRPLNSLSSMQIIDGRVLIPESESELVP